MIFENKISLLTYTHSSRYDVQKMYFDSINLFFPIKKHYILTNEEIKNENIINIIYNEDLSYSEQMMIALELIDSEYVIYSQEDYILYDHVDLERINNCLDIFSIDNDVNFIRLISSGVNGNEKNYNEDFIILDKQHPYFFSTQITLWRKKILYDMFKTSKVYSIFDEEKNSIPLRNLRGIGLCTKLKGTKVGGHYNSLIYPYIATAIVRGKWNFSEYQNQLVNLLNIYNIDYKKRGIL